MATLGSTISISIHSINFLMGKVITFQRNMKLRINTPRAKRRMTMMTKIFRLWV